jgi:hypothetical protein
VIARNEISNKLVRHTIYRRRTLQIVPCIIILSPRPEEGNV